MATTQFTITIDDDYTVPEGELTAEQYLAFVMNMAAQSYCNQYGAADKAAGIDAARAAYNAALPETHE